MSKFANVAKILGIIVAVVLLGALIGWLGSRNTSTPAVMPVPTNATVVDPVQTPVTNRLAALQDRPPTRPPTVRPNPNTPLPTSNLITNWEDKIDEILSSDTTEADKAKQMEAIFPRLPEDGQVEVAQHLSNLVSDQDYSPLGSYMTNSALPESVLDVLLADLLNRANSVKLPMLLQVAQDPQNPKSSEAKDLLELFLEEDYGNNWAQWQARMQQWLQDNPD